MIRCVLFACLLGASFASQDFTISNETMLDMASSFNVTSDDLHITCDTMSFTLPGVNVLLFQDVAQNASNITALDSEAAFNFTALDDGLNSENETDSLDYDYSKLDDGLGSEVDTKLFDYTKLDDGLDTEESNSTDFDYTKLDDGLESENATIPGNFSLDDDIMFDDDVMETMKEMGFPFDLSCQMESADFINVGIMSVDNSTGIVEILSQVLVNGTASGMFLTPEMSQDYRVSCSGQGLAHMHTDSKESMTGRWMNSDELDIENGTTPAICVFSVLDTNGNFWQMLKVQATMENATAENMTADSSEEEEKIDLNEKTQPTTTDIMTDMSKIDMSTEESDSDMTPKTSETDMTDETSDGDMAIDTTEETDKEVDAGEEETDKGQTVVDFEMKTKDDDMMGDLGEIPVDGQTYMHHCINNDLVRVLVPYTGCSDFLTVIEGLPRAYQTCGIDKCFDKNNCECKDCSEVTCDKLAPGTSQSYSISIYNSDGKEVGVISGERTRTVSGGLTESISARGDPRSAIFPIEMK